MKCDHCGAKIRKNDDVCKNCGKELYVSQFVQEAREVEEDMNNISDLDIRRIENEQKNHKNALTYEEFKQQYYIRNPLPRIGIFEFKGKMLERYVREQKIKTQYDEYLYTFDGQNN